MVFQYLGYDISEKEIEEEFWPQKNFEKEGVGHKELVKLIMKFGFSAFAKEKFGLEGIIRSIDRKSPVIARIRSTKKGFAHICVVSGYEKNPNCLWVNDPAYKKKSMVRYKEFSDDWKIRRVGGTNQYGLVIRIKN